MKKIKFIILLSIIFASSTVYAQINNKNLITRCKPKEHQSRCRFIELKPAMLMQNGQPLGIGEMQPAKIVLFDNAKYNLVFTNVNHENGSWIWSGYLDGIEYSYFYIVEYQGIYLHHYASPEGVFEIAYEAGNIYRIYQVK